MARKAKKAKAKKASPTKAAKRARSSRPATRTRAPKPSHEFTQGLFGWITHTDLASNDPAATKEWCAKVLGWTFTMDLPGRVHLFSYSPQGGGAVRPISPPETPGSIPYVYVPNAQQAFDNALAAGAEEMLSPVTVMEGVTVAIVRAPGGVPIGFSGP